MKQPVHSIQSFLLPMPPTANHNWKKGKGGRIYKAKQYTDWEDEAGKELLIHKPDAITGPFEIEICINRKRKNMDLDNRIKPILDLLEKHKIVEDDKLCERITAQWVSEKNKKDIPGVLVMLMPARETQ